MSDTTVIYRPRRRVGQMYTTRLTRQMNAPRPAVYRALLDAGAVAGWRASPSSHRGHPVDPLPEQVGVAVVS